jgi:hypothetical protein
VGWAAGGLAGWAKREAGLQWLDRTEAKRKSLGRKRKLFCKFLKGNQTNEFKHRFEFNQSKIVLQHECNNKLLWFIYLIKNN